MISEIISNSKYSEVLKLIQTGEFDKVIDLIESLSRRKKGFFSFLRKRDSDAKASFSLKILESCLKGQLIPSEYTKTCNLPFEIESLPKLDELFRILFVFEDSRNAFKKEKLIATTLIHCIEDGVTYISENAKNYPQDSMNAGSWMEGAGLRSRADELANYFGRKNNDQKELEALFLKAKLTNTIMNHYPHLVGPDMIAIAHQYEKIGDKEKAKQFYNPVVLDFTRLVQDIKSSINGSEIEILEEDFPVTQSLIDALEGLKRINYSIDENELKHAQEVMHQLRKHKRDNNGN